MHRDIPPLSAVRVFEAVARHLSFTRAANELGMTQAAASYQIRLLEERLGQPLFVRKARRIELTEAAQFLSPEVTGAFERLSSAFATTQEQVSGLLTLRVHTTFAAQWLIQRIGCFRRTHPNLSLRLDASVDISDFDSGEIDMAVRAGSGEWPGFASHLLVESVFTPMLTPRLLAVLGGLREPADLLRYPLYDGSDPWWSIWFDLAGVPSAMLPPLRTSCFGTQFLEGMEVLAGESVGILNPILFCDELASGHLVQPFDILGRGSIEGYWLVYPEGRRNVPKIKAFRDWILGEIASAGQPPASEAS